MRVFGYSEQERGTMEEEAGTMEEGTRKREQGTGNREQGTGKKVSVFRMLIYADLYFPALGSWILIPESYTPIIL